MSHQNLNYSHPIREQEIDRWNFLYRSFLGGQKYRDGKYLHKYWGEGNAPFDAYQRRLDATPLDNHVKTTVDIYRSYIWKNPPYRSFNNLESNPFVESFMNDADRNGQSLDSWMKDATAWAMVLGEVWILMDKPSTSMETAQDEIENDMRAYVTMYTPQNIMDWDYVKTVNGSKKLTYVKTIEWKTKEKIGIKIWTPDIVYYLEAKIDESTGEIKETTKQEEYINALGKVPFIRFIPMPAPGNTCGISMMGDVADMQRSIYNKLSELEQNIRISNHPVLVKTHNTSAEAGAGAIINVDDDLESGLMPKLLQPSGASISGILDSIQKDIECINSATHLTAVRAQKTAMSGVALQTERQLLNARLSDLSDTIKETEDKIWDLWCDWMDLDNNIEVTYSHHFDSRDPGYEMELISKAMTTIADPAFNTWAKKELVQLVIRDETEMSIVLNSLSESIEVNDDTETNE